MFGKYIQKGDFMDVGGRIKRGKRGKQYHLPYNDKAVDKGKECGEKIKIKKMGVGKKIKL